MRGEKFLKGKPIYQLFYFVIFNEHVFTEKINMIKMEFSLLETCLPAYSFVDIDIVMPVCTVVFDTFQPLSCNVLLSIIHNLNKTICGLDPFPTKLLMSHLSSTINIVLRIVNICFSSGVFPASCLYVCNHFILIEKQGLDSEILKTVGLFQSYHLF